MQMFLSSPSRSVDQPHDFVQHRGDRLADRLLSLIGVGGKRGQYYRDWSQLRIDVRVVTVPPSLRELHHQLQCVFFCDSLLVWDRVCFFEQAVKEQLPTLLLKPLRVSPRVAVTPASQGTVGNLDARADGGDVTACGKHVHVKLVSIFNAHAAVL